MARSRQRRNIVAAGRKCVGGTNADNRGLAHVELTPWWSFPNCGGRGHHCRQLHGTRKLGRWIAAGFVQAVTQRPQFCAKLQRAGVTPCGIFGQRGHDDGIYFGWQGWIDRRRQRNFTVAHAAQRLEIRECRKQRPASEQLPQQDRCGKHIAAWIDMLVASLLRRNIGKFAAHAADAGVFFGAFGDAKVGELDLASPRDQNI